MSVKGIQVTQGSIVVLQINGALVYVEEVQPTKCKLVALPDQPTTYDPKEQFLTPGSVKARVVSPYIAIEKEVAVPELSDRNRQFLGDLEKLREQHGDKYVDQIPEEAARMSVKKAQPSKKTAKVRAQQGASQETPDQEAPATKDSTDDEPKEKRARKPRRDVDRRFKRVAGREIPKEVEKKNGELETKFNAGNRGWKVLDALEKLGGEASIQEVVDHLAQADPHWCAHPAKVVTRALTQLTDEKFGAILEVLA